MDLQLVSLGYERRDIQEFIDVLSELHVSKVLDIRQHPLSRKKDFSKIALSRHLQNVGICYEHIYEAGNPYHRMGLAQQECLQLYTDYLQSNPQIIDLVESYMDNESTVALLCYERKHNDCHRSVLIKKLIEHNNEVRLFTVE